MNKLLRLLVLMSAVAAAQAHPGVGIVQDSRGNVFFTDLKQVWKISPDGGMSVAVSNVHTHELCVDAENRLYGEHLWGEGSGWRHRVWCLRPDGILMDVIPAREGFLSGYSFVRDGSGNMYWADRGEKTGIRKRSPAGKMGTHATADFRAVQWMTARPDGTLFVMDGGDLRRVSVDGEVRTIATKLSASSPAPAQVSERNYHMGLWTDQEGSPYVAVAMERLVLKVHPNGRVEVFARSPEPWSPSGGMFDRDGNLWLLEYNPANAVRTRRIARDGHDRIFTTARESFGDPSP